MTIHTYYPFGGMHHVLYWQNRNGGCHVVLAKSQDAITSVVKTIVRSHASDASLKFLSNTKIEIVLPPPSYVEKIEAAHLKKKVRSLMIDFASIMHNYEKLPKPFAHCQNYHSVYNDGSYTDDEHYDCNNCYCKLTVQGLTPEELYLQISQDWNEQCPSQYKRQAWEPVSRATLQATEEELETLWVANSASQSCYDGISFSLLKKSSPEEIPLFYFRLLENFGVEIFNQMALAAHEEYSIRLKANADSFKKIREDQDQQDRDAFFNFFSTRFNQD